MKTGCFCFWDYWMPEQGVRAISTDPFGVLRQADAIVAKAPAVAVGGQLMGALAGHGGLAGPGGIAGRRGGIAG